MAAKPTVLAMVPCRDVRRETPQSFATIVEATWSVRCDWIPARFTEFKVYIAITEVHDPAGFRLRWGPADQSERGYGMNLTVDTKSPLDAREIIADLKGWEITSPGQWVLDLYWQGQILMSRRIMVRRIDE